jgi:hypothetical protein
MDFTRDYSRVSAFGGGDEEGDGSSRDPELEEEFMSRDWPEASQPLQGGKLQWQQRSDHWSRSGGGRDAGPYWSAKAADTVNYQILASRNFNENWRGDYYTYEFSPVCIWVTQPKKGKPSQRRSEVLGGGHETLAEAQKVCEDHFQDNFGE